MDGKEIIIVATYITNGGAERVLSLLIKEWIAKGNKVTVIQLAPKQYDDQFPMPDKVEWLQFKSYKGLSALKYFLWVVSLIKVLRKRKKAVVLAFVNPAIYTAGATSFFVGNRIVFSERCDPSNSPTRPIMRKVRDLIYNVADTCVFQTEEARQHFSAKVQRNGVVIPNPINPDLPEMFQGERRKTIIAACRLDKQKNIPMMLAAFAKLSREHPEYTLEIYGRGEEEVALQKMIEELGLSSKVKLMGFSQNIYEKMRDCSMYVSSSDYEGISNSMLEAMALGIPCVCTDCPAGGARLAIQDGENGLLVPVGDRQAMYEAMKRIIEGPELAVKLSSNAYLIREKYSLENICQKWLEVF